ncbi:MAG: hypothetical protein EXS38_04645 [Opitutus sp.]|nr:hypothetical protein [Opitutus sp.]
MNALRLGCLAFLAPCVLAMAADETPFTVYLAPNTHGTVSGWLVDFDAEKSHVLNNYVSHMDRVASDPNYALSVSEVPNLMALRQFSPPHFAQLQRAVKEGRMELVNGFFLEPTINLSGGEALVQMGALGLRWYDEIFQRRPRFAWMIDVCGVHRQMPQIVAGLGLEGMFFLRNNPAATSTFRWVAPDGSGTIAICLAPGYASRSELFKHERSLTAPEMESLHQFFREARALSPSSQSVFRAVGGGDYSLAPRHTGDPSELLTDWRSRYPQVDLRFTVPGTYFDVLRKEMREGKTSLTEYRGDTLYSYNAFWMNLPEIKLRYRQSEHLLQAAEFAAVAKSLIGRSAYPSLRLQDCWLLMLLNMDRNVLWGGAAGAPFYSSDHWNVADRFDFVERTTGELLTTSLRALTVAGSGAAVFNPLNWERSDPIAVSVPPGLRPAGLDCEAHGDRLLVAPVQRAAGLTTIRLEAGKATAPQPLPFQKVLETVFYRLELDERTGAIVSLREKTSGREYLGGPANVVRAESVAKIVNSPADWMVPRPKRTQVDASSNYATVWETWRGPLTTTVVARSGFIGTSTLERRITLYRDFPRIDFQTTVDLHHDDVVLTVDFPLAESVAQRTRGVPYGFSSGDPRQVAAPLAYFLSADQKFSGVSDALAPSIRWSDYSFAEGGGLALFDRGLPCHELNGNVVTLALLNAQRQYNKLPNTLLAGQGRRTFGYALWPHAGTWQQARVPQHAWEYTTPVILEPGRVTTHDASYLTTSPNLIVEGIRRIGPDIEIRLAECFGAAAAAEVRLNLPHQNARRTNLMGEQEQRLEGRGGNYRLEVKPQQIVTLRFATSTSADVPPAILSWDHLVPREKLGALHELGRGVGHPSDAINQATP